MKIEASTLGELHAHAVETYPDECCGVVVVLASGEERVVRVRNVQDEMHARDPERYPRTARTAYSGHPGDLKQALELGEAPGNRLAAFYHSHPDHDAYFSEEDVAQATPFGEPSYPDALQIVVSVRRAEVRETKGFAWDPATESFVEVVISGS